MEFVNPTGEQGGIVNTRLTPGKCIKIIALAGTGKTTTLEMLARKNPDKRILYIVFSRANKIEAEGRFPKNVRCVTGHGLAFPKYGIRVKHRLNGNIKPPSIMNALDIPDYRIASYVIDTLIRYYNSADETITQIHVPFNAKVFCEKDPRISAQEIVGYAKRLGKLVFRGEDPNVPCVHDCYLKRYSLDRPDFSSRYDVIMMDEAQDTNPALTALVMGNPANLRNICFVICGDPHQQIYGWRNARNFMDQVDGETFPLTESFRFNSKIAYVATMILQHMKQESLTLKGRRPKIGKENLNGHMTFISRTNAGIFARAAEDLDRGKSIGFFGGIQGYRFHSILDGYRLLTGKGSVADPFISGFGSFDEYKDYAKEAEDIEALCICKAVEEYRHRIPGIIRGIKTNTVSESEADTLFTTAHKSKGNEWPCVYMGDDFPPLLDEDGNIDEGIDPEECNLQYVSITRAMDRFVMGKENPVRNFIETIIKKDGSHA